MWPFGKKKTKADLAVEWLPRAIDAARLHWLEFEAQTWTRSMPLTEKIPLFCQGLEARLGQWKAYRNAPRGLIILIAAKGIERSRTHLRLEVEAVLNLQIPTPHERTDDEEQEELKKILVDRAVRKWIYFTNTLKFNDSVTLDQRIESFKIPFLEGLRRDYVMFREAVDNEFDFLIAIAIDKSGTHSIFEVQKALGIKL